MGARTEAQQGNSFGDGLPTSTATALSDSTVAKPEMLPGQTALAVDPFLGRVLSHYRLEERLGAGGMGVLYRATDLKLGRAVAIKLLARHLLSDETAKRRFVREARAASALDHPNIGTVHDICEQDGELFIVMALYEGETLKQRLEKGPLSVEEALDVLRQVALGLVAAHGAGIVHRDIKPANILITSSGMVKILDFGLAKLVSDSQGETMTQTGQAVGTVLYMSPEQLRGERVDARGDLWSLGVLAYELLAGVSPFQTDSSAVTVMRILSEEPPALASVPGVPSWLAELITELLRKAPAERPQSASEVLRRLDHPASTGGGRPKARRSFLGLATGSLVAAAVGVAVAAGATFFYFRGRAQALTERDSILLADFVNTTGESVFDDTLRQALAVKLEESPFLNAAPEERVRETLRGMGRSPDQRLDAATAREVCQRQGAKAMVSGQIAQLGSHYVIALNAVNCHTGDSLARGQVEAGRKEEVLRALGKAASDLRGKLGESLSSIRKFDVPIEQATTTSLEALKAYTLANRERAQGTPTQAIPLFQRAIELDPNFAMAYAKLGVTYANLREPERAAEYNKKAFELRDRVSELERLYITSVYYGNVTGELEKLIETVQLWKRTYPRDSIAWGMLAHAYFPLGMWDKSIGESQEATRLEPNNTFIRVNLASAYLALNRFEESKTICEQQILRENSNCHMLLYSIAFIQGDSAGMERQVEWAGGKPDEDLMLRVQAEAAAFSGKLQRAREHYRQSAELAQRRNFKERAGTSASEEALTEAEFGNSRQARERAAAALPLAPDLIGIQKLAQALALSGKADQALALTDDLSRRFPHGTLVNALWVPVIRASVEVERGNPQAAVELLQSAEPYELGVAGISGLTSIYVRGKANLRARAGREAAAQFQKILDHRGVSAMPRTLMMLHPLAQLGLARAYALAGDSAQSRKAYQDFLALWKDADPDIPILLEARAEYAKLN